MTSPLRRPQSSNSGDVIPKGYEKAQLSQFTPEQMNLYKQMFSNVGPDSYLSKIAGGDEAAFREMEAPAERDFAARIGGIASTFSGGSGRGSLGSRRSSSFQNSTTAAASNFSQDIAARRHDLRRQALQDLTGMSNDLLNQRPYQRALVERPQEQETNYWGDIGGRFAAAVPGAVAGFATGGPAGAGIGAATGFFSGPGTPQKTSGQYGLPTFMGR